jgi:hypothetical protein
MIRRLQGRVKNWWDIWVFVIGFPIGLMFVFFLWGFLLRLSTHPIWVVVVSIVCLYGVIIMLVSAIIAVSENNIFISSFILLLIGVVVAVLGYFYTQGSFQLGTDKLVNDFYANISTELISVVITVLAIETLRDRLHWRNYQREKQSQEAAPRPMPSLPPERAAHEHTSEVGTQNSSMTGVVGLGSMLIGLLLGIVIGQNWKGFFNRE